MASSLLPDVLASNHVTYKIPRLLRLRLCGQASEDLVRRGFAVFLIVIAAKMLVK
jgi:hypothetical protein